MQPLEQLVAENQPWVLHRLLEYSKKHGYSRYTSTLAQAWEASVEPLAEALLEVIRSGEPVSPLTAENTFTGSTIDDFCRTEAVRHRARGITPAMFFGLAKYYRRSFVDLITDVGYPRAQEATYVSLVEGFFDRVDVSFVAAWSDLDQDAAAGELRDLNRRMTNEKNKYLTIFESMHDPVILLDVDGRIENTNDAADQLLAELGVPGARYYDDRPSSVEFGWLRDELQAFREGSQNETAVETSIEIEGVERHFIVKVKRMLDVSEKYSGIVLILDDVTERRMREEVVTVNRAIRRWIDRLMDISRRISRMQEAEHVLPLIGASAGELLQAPLSALGLWRPQERLVKVTVWRCDDPDHARARELTDVEMDDFSVEEFAAYLDGAGAELLESGGTWESGEEGQAKTGLQPGLAVPLRVEDRLVGALWVTRADPFSPSGSAVLESLAHLAAIVIDHDRLTARMQSQAVIDERARIAREMHDGLAQILGFLNLEMQSLEALVRSGEREQILEELARARAGIADAQVEVRQNILNLHTALAAPHHFIPALREQLEEFGARAGVEVRAHVEVDEDLDLNATANVQFMRIVQEALTNVRQHAHASTVSARLSAEGDDELVLVVEDDGDGFEPDAPSNHFGLRSMRERAAVVGGSLDVSSRPGEGTRIRLRIPLGSARRAASPGERP